MIVRIRFGTRAGRGYHSPVHAGQRAEADEEVHTPLPVHPASRGLIKLTVALTLIALWRLSVDLQLVPWFFADLGLLSHWQVWFGLAMASQGIAFTLNRRVRRKALASFASLLQTAVRDDKPSNSKIVRNEE